MKLQPKNALILGASSGVGRALANALAARGLDVTLVARDKRDLETLAADLEVRFRVKATALILDLNAAEITPIAHHDIVMVTAGYSSSTDNGSLVSSKDFDQITSVNFTSLAKLLLPLFSSLKANKFGYLGVCSTIAAPVPRTNNMIYAAAKNGLESLVRSFQHAAAGTGLKIQIFRLGYVDTSLSYGQKLMFPALSPAQVADKMLNSMDARSARIVYIPGFWRLIVLILQLLPWAVFSKLRF